MSAFVTVGVPSPERAALLLCEDHVGTYCLPYPCRHIDGAWRNQRTGEAIEATVIGWRTIESGPPAAANPDGSAHD